MYEEFLDIYFHLGFCIVLKSSTSKRGRHWMDVEYHVCEMHVQYRLGLVLAVHMVIVIM